MSDAVHVTADEVLQTALSDLPAGAYLTAALVLVSYMLPGENTENDRGPFLAWRRSTDAPVWVFLGMVESLSGDLRASLLTRDEDD